VAERRSSIEIIEAFHLVVLRVFQTRLNRASYVVKGGVNLRAWFGSLRYSEDLDIDVLSGEPHALEERVDGVFGSRDLTLLLRAQGQQLVRISKPKQTDTTQRWKLQVAAEGSALPLPTKIEFSRRGSNDDHVLEPVRAEIVRPYGIPAPSANHYTAASAIRQKIRALAGRSVTQARDVWDLDHLFRTTRADPRPLPQDLRKLVAVAIDRAMDLPFEAFKAQVVPYLAAEHHSVYGSRDAWERMCELVVDELEKVAQ
jgi:predicted nucleotidyltransferase component of viral defense system